MDVIALVGPSGTGKSHRALMVARQNNADAIIDDGLLIKNNKIIAGHSAKREVSKIMAIRRAVFVVPGHAEEVKEAIQNVKPERILILGTSENMVHRIAKALDLPPISRIINIADIATKAEMAKAQFYRNKEGKHIIPVPTIELKPHFSGYLVDPIQSFFKKSSTKRRRLGEKSIVSSEGKKAVTEYRVLDRVGNKFALIEAKPLTGRTHQIRAHLEYIGTPIVGDDKYFDGKREKFTLLKDKLYLHAYKIDLSGIYNKLKITAELPAYFAEALDVLGLQYKE